MKCEIIERKEGKEEMDKNMKKQLDVIEEILSCSVLRDKFFTIHEF